MAVNDEDLKRHREIAEQNEQARRAVKKTVRSMTKEERTEYYKRLRSKLPFTDWLKDLERAEKNAIAVEATAKRGRIRKHRTSIARKVVQKRKKGTTPLWIRRKIARDKVIPKNKVCRFCGRGPLKSKQFVVKNEWCGCLICWRKGVGRTDYSDGSKEK